MNLNATQIHLLNEQYNDRIRPCIKEILMLAKTVKIKEVCVYLILKALQGTEDDKSYKKLLIDYLGEKQNWLQERLISLNKLFQSNNSEHLFIRYIVDKRFYVPNMDMSQDEWILHCKNLVTNEYFNRIHAEINTLTPDIYSQASLRIQTDIQHNEELPSYYQCPIQ